MNMKGGGRGAVIALAAGLSAAMQSSSPKSSQEARWRAELGNLWQSGKPAWRKRFPGFGRQIEANKDA